MEELVNRCLMAGLPGTSVPAPMEELISAGLGGVILFGRNLENAEQVRALTGAARAVRGDLLVGVDEEGVEPGHFVALGGPPRAGNHALGALDDVDLTRRVGADIGAYLSALGINVDFAPCADVNTLPENPVIGVRSFGADPALVARHTDAFTAGVQAAGVAACAKHFPGHGGTRVDSHVDLPEAELTETDLTPFLACAPDRAAMVLAAHVRYRGLGDEPASLNRRILTGLLREELGFRGVAATDALEMGAVSGRMAVGDAAVRALAAGADLLLLGSAEVDVWKVRDAVLAAVADGRLPGARVEEAAGRVRELAERFAAPAVPAPAGAGAGGPDAEAGERLAARLAPEPLGAAPYVVEMRGPDLGFPERFAGLPEIAASLDPAAGGVVLSGAPPGGADRLLEEAAAAGGGRRPLVVGVQDAHRAPWMRGLLAELLERRPDAVVIGTGLADDAAVASGAAAFLPSYGRSPALLRPLLAALLGRSG
ncbi:glycoside hydrolase family 3 protein [Nocardiopsis composta]|uniref:Beta-N-acetylhexosaminidase n=1 Tax=Nocardiopsis composta TaxID=157465 RepID=A0A7W8QJM4_9ACTN|nr:glycoside hydrolase family 3 protein [Nocardiopsis composta]MBB5431480.1 beta-N-acetylhexosaminidase [Nocardiopsis composta]